MRLLIIGAGQDGQLAAARACELSIPTLVLSRSFPKFIQSIAERYPQTITLTGQAQNFLTQGDSLELAVRDFAPTAIFYTASHHGPSGTMQNDSESSALYRETGELGLQRVSDAISRFQPRAGLFFSLSSRMFRPSSQGFPVSESSQPDPVDAYGEAKARAWEILKDMRKSGLAAGGAIFFNHDSFLKGPGYLGTDISEQLGRLLFQGGEEKVVRLRNPDVQVDISNAWDFVCAAMKLLSSQRIDDYVFSSGSLVSVRELVETSAAALGLDVRCEYSSPSPESAPAPAVFGDYSKLRQALESDWASNASEAIALGARLRSGRLREVESFLRNRENVGPRETLVAL
jgi:GDP-D-mannose dehydratase